MSDALASITGAGGASWSEGSLTQRALQQALAEGAIDATPTQATPDADPSPVVTPAGTSPGDPLPDAAPSTAALVARGQSPKRAGMDHIDSGAAQGAGDARLDLALPDLAAARVSNAMPSAAEPAAVPTVAAVIASLQASSTGAGSLAPGWRPPDDTDRRRRAAPDEPPADEDEDPQTAAPPGGRRPEAPADREQARHDAAPIGEDELQAALRELESLAETDPPWCQPLLSGLRAQARQPDAAALLRVALTQWRTRRAVLLAAPKSGTDSRVGWLHALRVVASPTGQRLSGQRFAVRLVWQAPTPARQWWGVRATKQQGLHIGQQLVAQADLPERATAQAAHARPPALALRLGTPLGDSHEPAPSVLCIEAEAVARLWSAIELQWHVALLACSQPLYAATPGGPLP